MPAVVQIGPVVVTGGLVVVTSCASAESSAANPPTKQAHKEVRSTKLRNRSEIGDVTCGQPFMAGLLLCQRGVLLTPSEITLGDPDKVAGHHVY